MHVITTTSNSNYRVLSRKRHPSVGTQGRYIEIGSVTVLHHIKGRKVLKKYKQTLTQKKKRKEKKRKEKKRGPHTACNRARCSLSKVL